MCNVNVPGTACCPPPVSESIFTDSSPPDDAAASQGPGLKQGSVVKNLTSLLDVYPTLVAMTGATPPDFLEGHSLFPLMAAGTTAAPVGQSDYPQDRFVVSQYHSNMGNTGSFMIRWRRFKYITYG